MCTQPVVYPQRRLIFSTTQVGWLPVPYYTQQSHRRVLTHETHSFNRAKGATQPPDVSRLTTWGTLKSACQLNTTLRLNTTLWLTIETLWLNTTLWCNAT